MTDNRGIAISSGWVLVMILAIAIPLGYLAFDHANANQDRATRHSNALTEQKFNQALSVTEEKFRQAMRISTYSINRSVCGFRGLGEGALKAARSGAKDPRLSPAIRERNRQNAVRTEAFLESQVTVPAEFDCKSLPKNPPKGTP